MEPKSLHAGWSPKQSKFALRYAFGRTIAEAARKADVTRRTAHNWMAIPEFRAYIDTLRDTVLEDAVNLHVRQINRSIGVVAGLLESEDENIRLRAAQVITDGMLKYWSAVVTNRRLGDLERRARERGGRTPEDAAEDEAAAEARSNALIRTWLRPDGPDGPAPSENGNGDGHGG
jgi:hypothetical protein